MGVFCLSTYSRKGMYPKSLAPLRQSAEKLGLAHPALALVDSSAWMFWAFYVWEAAGNVQYVSDH